MKTKISISEIARRMNLSKSTVSKALGDKPGVDEETKKNILKYAKSVGFFTAEQEKDIVLMIPERYKAMCSVFQKILNDSGLFAKCGIYSGACEYIKILKDMAKNPPSLLVVMPAHTEGEEKLLKKFKNIWFIGDMINLENAFYFGINPLSEGCALAQEFVLSGVRSPIFVHSCKSVINSKRTELFARLIAKEGIYNVANLMVDEASGLSVPYIARKLSRVIKNADSIYCGDEIYVQVKKALVKLGADDIKVFSYTDDEKLKSSVYLLTECAKKYLENGDYPPCKYNFTQG